MYWLVSLPGAKDETWRTLENATGRGNLSENYRFELPMSLRVGSLDALMVLSDDLARVNVMVEGVVNKIRRQAHDLAPDEVLQVNNRPVASFLTSFAWDEARYPLRKPLKEIVEELTESVVSVDDDLKVRVPVIPKKKQLLCAPAPPSCVVVTDALLTTAAHTKWSGRCRTAASERARTKRHGAACLQGTRYRHAGPNCGVSAVEAGFPRRQPQDRRIPCCPRPHNAGNKGGHRGHRKPHEHRGDRALVLSQRIQQELRNLVRHGRSAFS